VQWYAAPEETAAAACSAQVEIEMEGINAKQMGSHGGKGKRDELE
jgi:hypothetical protein